LVLQSPENTRHPLFSNIEDRVRNRGALDEVIRKALEPLNREQFIQRLRDAKIAFGLIRSMEELLDHPALTMTEVDTPTGPVRLPQRALPRTSSVERKSVPAYGANTAAIRKEFASDNVPSNSPGHASPV
jgi:crotonobetainyl-CoA:carnitine CoA-transferase CaiB-like acyl-CoA transferase